ncbi:MAG TPA: AAA family ATPase, partial [Actinocrinis sp.]|nr:AAA family ATPase [Actinocrinis sp.]
LQEWSPPIDRPVMLYWTGHGRPVDVRGDLCLLYSDSPVSLIKGTEQAMTATRLGGLIAQRRVKRAILLVDACNAGGGADEIIRAFNRRRMLAGERDGSELRLAVISSAFGTQAASELAFSEALRTILTTDDSYFRPRDRWLTVDDIYSALKAALADSGQNPDIQTSGSIGAVFLNPWHIPNLPDVLVEAKTSAAAAIAATGAEHFLLKFRGIDVLTDQGWFFTGRQYTWERLREWIAGPGSGIFVLTGYPGSGKSALLGRLAVLSDPQLRAAAAEAGALEPQVLADLPQDGPLDAGVHARRLTLHDSVQAFAAALGVPAANPRELLAAAEEIGARRLRQNRSLVLMLDALDEAQRTDRRGIAVDLLRPLANLPGVKVVVGLRQELPDYGGPEQAHLLSLHRALGGSQQTEFAIHEDPSTETDIAEYIVKRLAGTHGSPYHGDPDAAALVAKPLARRCAGIFLPAQIFSRVLAHPGPVEDPATVAESALFSPDLRAAFDEDLRRFEEQEADVRAIVAPLAWAEGRGLPLREVWGAVATALRDLNWTGPANGARPRLDAASISALIDAAGVYLIEGSEDGQTVYRLYHDEFARYLRADYPPAQIQHVITQALLNLAGPPGRRDWAQTNPYIRRHLSAHAAASGLLPELVADPGFLAHADPDRLTRVLTQLDRRDHPMAQLYLRVAHRLGTLPPRRRAEALHESALRDEPDLLPRLGDLPYLVWRGLASSASPRPFHRTLLRRGGPLTMVGFARMTDRQLLISRAGAVVRVWDAESGERLQTHNRLRSPGVLAAVGRKDQTAVLVLAEAGGIGCWHVLTGERIGERFNPGGTVQHLTFGRLGDRDVIAAAVGDGVDLIEPGADRPLDRLSTGRLRRVAMDSADGTALLAGIGSALGGVWDATARTRLATLTLRGPATCVAVRAHPDADGCAVAVGYESGGIDYWERSDRPARTLRAAGQRVLALAFTDDEAGEPRLVSGEAGGRTVLWDPASGRYRQLQERAEGVAAIAACSVDGEALIATGSDDGDVRLWQNPQVADDKAADARYAPIPGVVRSVALSSDGGAPIVVVGTSNGAVQVRGQKCALLHEARVGPRSETRPVTAVAYDRGVLAAALGGRIFSWPDGPAGERVDWLTGSPYVHALLLDGVADRLLSAEADGAVRVWSARTGRSVASRRLDPDQPARAIAPGSARDADLVIAACGSTVYSWRPATDELAFCGTGHGRMVQSVAAGRLDGQLVVAAGDDAGNLTLLDLARREPIRAFPGHSRTVHAVAIVQLGGRDVLASASDGSVRLWDLRTGAELSRWTEGDERIWIRAAAFRFEAGKLLRVAATDHAINLAYAVSVSTSPDPE